VVFLGGDSLESVYVVVAGCEGGVRSRWSPAGILEVIFMILVGVEYHHDGREKAMVSERENERDVLDKHLKKR
jgi:hypothetical protein